MCGGFSVTESGCVPTGCASAAVPRFLSDEGECCVLHRLRTAIRLSRLHLITAAALPSLHATVAPLHPSRSRDNAATPVALLPAALLLSPVTVNTGRRVTAAVWLKPKTQVQDFLAPA